MMGNLFKIGRIFYSIGIAEIGLHAIYYHDFPYMLLPKHSWIPNLTAVAFIAGVFFFLAGALIVFEIKIKQSALVLGAVLLSIFCFYYIPYQIIVSPNYMQLADWENAEKELALAGGALVIASNFSVTFANGFLRFVEKLAPAGQILFSLPMISFGILHLMYPKEVSTMIPSWIPGHIFLAYFTGTALIGSGLAIVFKIKVVLFATLLGLMIFIWFITLHIPGVINSTTIYRGSEITSALLALAYSGTAFTIAGAGKKVSTVAQF